MSGRIDGWVRQGEAFWRAHHEAWKRSALNQREYCEAQCIPLKSFNNWRSMFMREPAPPAPKLLYRRGTLSHRPSHTLSHTLSHSLSHTPLPILPAVPLRVPAPREGHRRRFSETDRRRILEEADRAGASLSEIARSYGIARRVLCRWKQELAPAGTVRFVPVEIVDEAVP